MQNYGGFTTPTPVNIGSSGNPNWGSTFLGDLVTKVNFGSYVREAVYGNCRWVQSGIIQRNTALDMSSGGTRITVPYFKPFLAMAAIASYITDSVLRQRTATLRAMVDGVLDVGPMSTHTVNISRTGSGTSAEANFLTAASVIRAANVLGENAGLLTSIAMHSSVYSYLQTVGMLVFSTSSLSSGGNIAWGGGGVGITSTQIASFAGLNVIVDDQLAPTLDGTNGDKYPVLLFGQGAVQQGIQQDFRVEYERSILSKQDVASCDYHQLLHIDGVSYTGTDNPDNTTLSTAGSWALKYDHRQIPIVKMVVNTPFAQTP